MRKHFKLSGFNGFNPATSFPGGTGLSSVAAADFNGDGKLDLVTANGGGGSGNTVSVLLGNGAGSFGAARPFTVGTGPISVAAADFNGDGKLDLVTANRADNTVSVLLGNGDGSFGAASPFTVGTNPTSVAAADFNGDGKLDLVTANRRDNTVSVLLGNGDGSFGAASPFTVGTNPTSVSAADFNGDGKLDLVTANYGNASGNTVSVLLGNGAGSFGAASPFRVGTGPWDVAAADFNGDSKLDLVTANYVANTVSVLLGNGAGSFGAASPFTVGFGPISVAAADFNGDGKLGLVTANWGDNTVSVLLGDGAGSFGAASPFTVGTNPTSVAAADFNGDGILDLVTANNGDNTVSVLLGTPAPTSSPTTSPTTSPTRQPTLTPTVAPSLSPTTNPTEQPTLVPTVAPSLSPTPPTPDVPFGTFNKTIGTDGPDNITTTGGNNLVEGRGGADILDGGPGDNALSYATSPAGVTVSLLTGRGRGGDAEGDVFKNFNGILGSPYGDILTGDDNTNAIYGMGGNDLIEGKASGDRLDGGTDIDTVTYATSPAAVNVSFISGLASRGDATGDVLINLQNIIGSAYSDTLTGDNGINRIDGGDGNDILEGRGGADAINGGNGINTLSYASSPAAVMVNLGAHTSSGGDAEGDSFTNVQNILGSSYDDTLIGDSNANNIDGGPGSNTVSYAGSRRFVEINLVTNVNTGGDAEGDSLTNIQNILGSDFADILIGNANDNLLNGANGNDLLEGGGGNDLLIGGPGSDTFKIDSKSTNVTIQDFENNVDKIDLLDFNNLHRASHLTQTRTQGGMLISSSGWQILLQNIAQPLSNDQFIFNLAPATRSWWTKERISIISSAVGGVAALFSIAYTLYQCKKGTRCFKKNVDDYYAMDELANINAPIGIALDSQPIELISLEASQTSFDYFDNGIKAKTSWVGPKDAFLIYDHNDNQKVDAAKELVLTQWSSTAITDFMALKEVFDSNKDNKFDANDVEFNRFHLWQDKNQDGISQSNELTPLPKAGLVQIDFDMERTVDGEFFGREQAMQIAGVHWVDGHETIAYDLTLQAESLA
jgi:hypothetical protein